MQLNLFGVKEEEFCKFVAIFLAIIPEVASIIV